MKILAETGSASPSPDGNDGQARIEVENELVLCLRTAERAFAIGQCALAIRKYEQVLLCFKKQGVNKDARLRDCLKNLADLYILQDEPARAVEKIVALRQIEDNESFQRSHVTALFKTAQASESAGNVEEANRLLSQAKDLAVAFLAIKDPLLERLNQACEADRQKQSPQEGEPAESREEMETGLTSTFKKAATTRKSRISFMDKQRPEFKTPPNRPTKTQENQATPLETKSISAELSQAYLQETDTCLQSGELALQTEDYDTAVQNFSQALALLKSVADVEKSKRCLFSLLDSYVHLQEANNIMTALAELGKLDAETVRNKQTIVVLTEAAKIFADQERYDDCWSSYWKALELAGTLLPVDDPLVEELNQSYIELRKRYSEREGGMLKEKDAETVLAGSRKRRITNWQDKPVPSPPTLRPTNLAGDSLESNILLKRFTEAAAYALEHKKIGRAFQSHWFLLLVSACFVFVCARFSIVQFESGPSPQHSAVVPSNFSGMKFQTCDKLTTISFLTKDTATIDRSGHTIQTSYTVIGNGVPDLGSLILGYLRRNEIWYQYDASRIIGGDNIILYGDTAPESRVVRKMWWYADFAQRYYSESRLYPSDAGKCKQSDPQFAYTNPFTDKQDYAAIVLQRKFDGAANFTDAQAHNQQRHWRPGAIFCLNTEYKKFMIQGFDRNGKLLTSSDPNLRFTILCQNGINLSARGLAQTRIETSPPTEAASTRLFVTGSENMAGTVQWTRSLCQILLWTWLCLSSFWTYACHKSKSGQKALLWGVVSSLFSLVFLLAWYIAAFQPS